MSEDIGPGDVVEYVGDDLDLIGVRAVLVGFEEEETDPCDICRDASRPSPILSPDPAPDDSDYWCLCQWRKIGPSRSETVSRFAHHLTGGKVKERA